MVNLETERLVLRNFRPEDGEALCAMIVQYETSGMAVYDQQWPTTPDEVRGVAEWFASGDNFLAVCLKDTGQFIGFVALNPEPKETGYEYNLGYIFSFDFHGKGFAAEACRALLEYGFTSLGAERVVSGTAAANEPSWRLLERLGFQRTGESTGSFRKGVDGKPIAFVGYTYALVREDR